MTNGLDILLCLVVSALAVDGLVHLVVLLLPVALGVLVECVMPADLEVLLCLVVSALAVLLLSLALGALFFRWLSTFAAG
eukprot:CAMPEP_0172925652 /NCGR_PEP_ID=MMETSP1075-20121228/214121_1 /TAXON_ID=2916 /ORGANISM="Ceratium fusus, Strain PA161109" /LENGTH=79 /DNA_ID=CAMNT_0013786579 /DNA_START=159 /DNA_END=394 /DNA_ORIENTATION=+